MENENRQGELRAHIKEVNTTLAGLPRDTLLDEQALAQALGVCGRTVRRCVQRHELPEPIRLAGRSQWLAGRVLDHLHERAAEKEKEAKRNFSRLQAINP